MWTNHYSPLPDFFREVLGGETNALTNNILWCSDGHDFATNFTAALSCISNVGPGLGKIGPSGNFAIFSSFSKIVMAITMLFGRLEVYAMLILFIPSTWKRR